MVWTTGDNNYAETSYIVDPTQGNGNYQTIGAALTAASAASFSGDIFIRPGTYTENPTLVAGVNLVAWPADATTGTVIINGNCTLSTAGTVTISGIELKTNSAACVTVSGSVASILNLIGCNINCSNNTGITYSSSSASSQINISNCTGNLGTTGIGLYTMSSIGALNFYYTVIQNTGGSSTATTNSAGAVNIFHSTFNIPFSNSSTGNLDFYYTLINTSSVNTACVAFAGSGTNGANQSDFVSGTASAVTIAGSSTASLYNCQIGSTNTDCITGSGTLNYSGLSFASSSIGSTTSTINVTTQTGGVLIGGKFQAPSTGFIGEQVRATGTITPSTGATTNICSIALTPGIWDVSGLAGYSNSGAATTTYMSIVTSTGGTGTMFDNYAAGSVGVVGVSYFMLSIPSYRITLSASGTAYLTGGMTFTTGAVSIQGRISATRVG
jgi:hypothetical protein